MNDERIQVSREEVGLLMSYATRPHRLTEELVQQMVNGVTGPELLGIAAWVGLPQSTAVRLVDANRPTKPADRNRRGVGDTRFRRALVGILVVMLIANIATTIASDVSAVGVVLIAGAGAGAAYLVYRVIVAISPS